jgi:hypothetical protein
VIVVISKILSVFMALYAVNLAGAHHKGLSATNQTAQTTPQDVVELVVGVLPKSIDSLDSLQNYAAHYAWASNKQVVLKLAHTKTFNTLENPNLRLEHRAEEGYPYLERVQQVFKKYTFEKSASVVSQPKKHFYFYIQPVGNQEIKMLRQYFNGFLMSNNEDLMPEYAVVLRQLKDSVDHYFEQSSQFNDLASKLAPDEIASWLGLESFTNGQKEKFIQKNSYINNDLERLIVSLKFLVNHSNDIQILDLYLLAEQSFHNMAVFGRITREILESGCFFPKVDEDYNIPPLKDIEKVFYHRQIPLRSLYLVSRAIAFSFRNFVDRLRARAGLPPIPQEVFLQGETLKEALKIDESLLDTEDYIKEKKAKQTKGKSLQEAPKEDWTSDIPWFAQQKKAQKQSNIKKSQQPQRRKGQSNRKLTPLQPSNSSSSSAMSYLHEEDSLESGSADFSAVINTSNTSALPALGEVLAKESIGSRMYRLLKNTEKTSLSALFSLKQNTVSHEQANNLTMAVYKALIDLNKAHRAAEFLKKSSDARIFTKGKEEKLLSKESMEHRLLPYVLQDMIHPDFDQEAILKNSAFLNERVTMDKIMLHTDEIDTAMLHNLEDLLAKGEQIAQSAGPDEKRILLVSLAHAWHKLAIAVERAKAIEHKAATLDRCSNKILSLLTQALPILESQKDRPVTILEAYLYNYYLKQNLSPAHEELSTENINAIQRRAAESLKNPFTVPPKTIHKVSPSGKKIGEYQVDHSIFHAVTNDELGDYILVTFDRPMKERKIPLFVYYNDTIYRTDVFGGSRLKPNPGKGDYGSLIAVTLKAGEFFKHWFTSDESFWYGQRAFMPAKPNQKTKAKSQHFKVATIPDKKMLAVVGNAIVQDGFGYIKASAAKALNLKATNRSIEAKKYVAYQALHAYKSDRVAALELFNDVSDRLSSESFNRLNADERANALMCTLPKMTAIGIPVRGDNVVLPEGEQWRELGSQGIDVGRNPYSAPRLQVVDPKNIEYEKYLQDLTVFQYTLTGYIDEQEKLIGSFFKGLLAVIPDKDWPAEYKDVHMLVSSKDQKLNQTWLDKNIKDYDQNREQILDLYGMLVVKNEYHKNHLVGLPTWMAENLAGDYDGDPYDLMPRKNFSRLSALILEESKKVIATPKMPKSFSTSGNVFRRILDLYKPIVTAWNAINVRYYYLSESERQQLITSMAQSHMLKAWLGEDWRDKLGVKNITDMDIVIAEIQFGIKLGEDSVKTKVDVDSALVRAREYEKALNLLNKDPQIPYGNGLKKKLGEKQSIKEATGSALMRPKSANVVDKAFRGLARYSAGNVTYESYVSDDEEEFEAEDE